VLMLFNASSALQRYTAASTAHGANALLQG